jgi:hypothetical protein
MTPAELATLQSTVAEMDARLVKGSDILFGHDKPDEMEQPYG